MELPMSIPIGNSGKNHNQIKHEDEKNNSCQVKVVRDFQPILDKLSP